MNCCSIGKLCFGGLALAAAGAMSWQGNPLSDLRIDFWEGEEHVVEEALAPEPSLELLELGSRQKGLEVVQDILTEGIRTPDPASGRFAARVADGWVERFDPPYPSDPFWQDLSRLLWQDPREAGGTLEDSRALADRNAEFLTSVYEAASSEHLQAVALYMKVENRILADRELGGLSPAERRDAMDAVRTLQERFWHLPVPTGDATFGQLALDQRLELNNIEGQIL